MLSPLLISGFQNQAPVLLSRYQTYGLGLGTSLYEQLSRGVFLHVTHILDADYHVEDKTMADFVVNHLGIWMMEEQDKWRVPIMHRCVRRWPKQCR